MECILVLGTLNLSACQWDNHGRNIQKFLTTTKSRSGQLKEMLHLIAYLLGNSFIYS